MKKIYRSPIAKKIDYAFDEQIIAQSVPFSPKTDPDEVGVCTWTGATCFMIYYEAAKVRGVDNCDSYPGEPLPVKP